MMCTKLWKTLSFSKCYGLYLRFSRPRRYFSACTHIHAFVPDKNCLFSSDQSENDTLKRDMLVYNDFITEEEEVSLLEELEPYLKRMRYEYDHWDNAIHGYRETERSRWTQKNKVTLQRVRDIAFPPGKPQMKYVHVLDLEKDGYIKPHIDSTRFCGSVIAGLSLLSSSVMRLVNEANKTQYSDVLLRQRSLYIMRGKARFDYTHEVLKSEDSIFKGEIVPRDRRISVICRCDAEIT